MYAEEGLGLKSEKPCSKCGGSEAYFMSFAPGSKEMIAICEKCPYVQCRGCQAWKTIDDIIYRCKCNARDFCTACEKDKAVVTCPRCTTWTMPVCSRPECRLQAQNYFSSSQETCGGCLINTHCTHPFMFKKVHPQPESPVYCVFEIGEKATCSKWICSSCALHFFVADKGFFCGAHLDLVKQ